MSANPSSFSAKIQVNTALKNKARIFSVLALLTASVTSYVIAVIFYVDASSLLPAVYFLWFLSSVILFSGSYKYQVGFKRGPSAPGIFLSLLIFSLLMSTMLVGMAGLRGDIYDVARQVLMLVMAILPFYAVVFCAKRVDLDRAVLISCHFIFFISSASVFFEFFGLFVVEGYENRYFGFLGDGAPWLLTFPLVVYFSSARYIYFLIGFIALLLTLSRGAFLVVVAAVFLILIFRARRFRLRWLLVFLIPLLFFALSGDRLYEFYKRFSALELFSDGRFITSSNGMEIFFGSPIFGYGFNSLGYFYRSGSHYGFEDGFSVAASVFVQTLSDGGVFLFVPYILFCFSMSVVCYRVVSRQDRLRGCGVIVGSAAWLLSMLLVNQTASWFLANSFLTPVVFFVAGLVSGYRMRRDWV